MNIFVGLMIPFLGTTLGSAMVFLMKNKLNKKVEKILLGFASGVMIAASVWSLAMLDILFPGCRNLVVFVGIALPRPFLSCNLQICAQVEKQHSSL